MNRILLGLWLAFVPVVLSLAQDDLAKNSPSASSGPRGQDGKPPMAVTPEREAAVMTFVERNHPALKDVLASLKATRSKEYEKAIRDIYLTSERLANVKERDPHLFELELENWTLRSQIQLLTAQMVMAGSDEIRGRLRELLNKQMDVRVQMLKLEQQRARERLTRIEDDLARMESDREQQVEKQLNMLMKSAEASKTRNKVGGKSGSKRTGAGKNKGTVNEPARMPARK